jgi:hypothetical protein
VPTAAGKIQPKLSEDEANYRKVEMLNPSEQERTTADPRTTV